MHCVLTKRLQELKSKLHASNGKALCINGFFQILQCHTLPILQDYKKVSDFSYKCIFDRISRVDINAVIDISIATLNYEPFRSLREKTDLTPMGAGSDIQVPNVLRGTHVIMDQYLYLHFLAKNFNVSRSTYILKEKVCCHTFITTFPEMAL